MAPVPEPTTFPAWMIPTTCRHLTTGSSPDAVTTANSKSTPSKAAFRIQTSTFDEFDVPVALGYLRSRLVAESSVGAEGPVQSNHCEGTGRRVRLNGRSLFSKQLLSSQIIAGRRLNAPSDGAFAMI